MENYLITYKPYSNPNKFNPNANWSQRTKKKLIVNQTYSERVFYDCWKRNTKKRIIPQKLIRIKGKKYFIDFYIPFLKLAIEIDGGYHKLITTKDKKRDENLLLNKGIQTLRFTNEKILLDSKTIILNILATGV